MLTRSEETVVAEREKNIVLAAQRDKLLEANKRQGETIAKQDTCLNEKADEITRLSHCNVLRRSYAPPDRRDERIKHLEATVRDRNRRLDEYGNFTGPGMLKAMNDQIEVLSDRVKEEVLANTNAQKRITFLSDKVAGLETQARIRSAAKPIHPYAFAFNPGTPYRFTPKSISVEALFVGDIPATYEYRNPKSVVLTF